MNAQPLDQPILTLKHRVRAFFRRNAPYLTVLFLLFAFAVVFFFDQIVVSINSGERGVLWRRLGNGTELHTTYGEGVQFMLPIDKMFIYNTRKQQLSDSIDVLTVDGLPVKVGYSVRYFLSPDVLSRLHQSVGPNYVNVVVKPEVRAAIRNVFGRYKPEEIYNSQRAIQEQISASSKTQLQARFVALDDVPIETITLPPKIAQAIETKMTLQQSLDEYSYRLVIAEKEVKRKQLEADAVKAYNNTVAASLTPDVLTWFGIQASENLAKSNNSKTIVIGAGKSGLPIILGRD